MAGVVNTVVGSSADGLLDSVDSGIGFIKGRRLIRGEHLRRAGKGMGLSEARQNNPFGGARNPALEWRGWWLCGYYIL